MVSFEPSSGHSSVNARSLFRGRRLEVHTYTGRITPSDLVERIELVHIAVICLLDRVRQVGNRKRYEHVVRDLVARLGIELSITFRMRNGCRTGKESVAVVVRETHAHGALFVEDDEVLRVTQTRESEVAVRVRGI